MAESKTPGELFLQKLEKIRKEQEDVARHRRKIANEHIPESELVEVREKTPGEKLRHQVWENYYFERSNKICSRCGNYSRYEIEENKSPIYTDLNHLYGLGFYNLEYSIKSIPVLTKNSNDSEWGNICHKCRLHIMGKVENLLDAPLEDAEAELSRLRQRERVRRMYQDDKINAAKARRRKEDKEREEARQKEAEANGDNKPEPNKRGRAPSKDRNELRTPPLNDNWRAGK